MNNLVIVAHADDEILNMGGTLHQFKHEFWKIVCVTKDVEHGRDPQFFAVVRELNKDHHAVILGCPMGLQMKWVEENVVKELKKILDEKKWDRIFTHNSAGEYGHFQHRKLHAIVKYLADKLIVFGHNNLKGVNWEVELTDEDKEFKLKAAGIYTRKTQAIMAYDFFQVDKEVFGDA